MIAHIRLIAASALLVAGLVASQLVYLWAIIPRLSGWHSIPGIWYVPLMLPAVLGFLGAGIMLRDGREFLIAAAAAVFLGFGPFALTDSRPVESWPVALVNLYLVSAVCLAVSFVPTQLLRRRTAAERVAAADEARQQ
jgi:hypothetical protein